MFDRQSGIHISLCSFCNDFPKNRLIIYFLRFFLVLNSWFNFSGDGSSNSNKFAQYPRPKIVPVDYNKKKQVCVCEQCGGSWSRKEYYYHHKSVGKCTPKWIRYRWGSSDSFTLWFHQSRIPNLQKILTNIYYDFFFNWQTEEKSVFDQYDVLFFTAQTEKNCRKYLLLVVWSGLIPWDCRR